MNNLVLLLKRQGKLEEAGPGSLERQGEGARDRELSCFPLAQAECLHRRALEGGESQLGPQHSDTLIWVNNLANLLRKQGKLAEAGLRCRGVAFRSVKRKAFLGQDERLVGFLLFHRSNFLGNLNLFMLRLGRGRGTREPFEIECRTA